MDKDRIDRLAALSAIFSGSEWENAVALASRENPWFTPGLIRASAGAVISQMLDPGKLGQWLSGYLLPEGRLRLGMVTAGNIPLVWFADLLAALATGCEVWIKPSSKDRVLSRYVVEEVAARDFPVTIYEQLPKQPSEALIVTGTDGSVAYFEERCGGIPILSRGSRTSVAVLTGTETAEQLEALAGDILLYWGMGCRSVTRLFVPSGYSWEGLRNALERYPLDNCRDFTDVYRYARARRTLSGEAFIDCGRIILRQNDAFAVPALGEVFYSEYADLVEVERWLDRHNDAIQCVASTVEFSFARKVEPGETQTPALRDYADGVDTVDFLIGCIERKSVGICGPQPAESVFETP